MILSARPLLPANDSAAPERRPIGQVLLDRGLLNPGDMVRALSMRARQDVRLGDILVTHGMVSHDQLAEALAEQWDAARIDPVANPADARLIDLLTPEACLRDKLLPWRNVGGATVILTTRPEAFARHQERLKALFGPVCMALCTEADLHAGLLAQRRRALSRRAETRVALDDSCRNWPARPLRRGVMVLAALALALLLLWPAGLFGGLLIWAVLTLVLATGVKAAAAIVHLRSLRAPPPPAPPTIMRLPVVSVMVPMYCEPDIAPRLVARLGRLSYPKELLDVLLVIEEDDTLTRDALARATLPHWMRVCIVPKGPLKTKPRALNFALDFCRGSIVGVYDAEDAPEPDQIHRVVRRFHARGPDLACVQGVLDFYNPATNWLARCFTIEYAAWFRIVLPGMEKLGLAVPLGGTTLFFRRNVLEELGGWDAHNVTEDADLGIRLARRGYRTELLQTVTEEEANCRMLPWVKQRSRWLKGYAMTYAVHMRNPRQLLRDLGWWRFFGVQVLFGATLSQFLLAPFLWSFWLLALGQGHPMGGMLPGWLIGTLTVLFMACEGVNITVGVMAVSGRKHRFLRKWVPSLQIYFPLGALAAYKGLWELMVNPYYWDKTAHGIYDTPQPLKRAA